MTAGFQSFAQDGSNVIQIDSEVGLPNYQLRTKITQQTQAGSFPVYTVSSGARYVSNACVTTFNFSAISPLVVFECPADYVTPLNWVRNGNSYSVQVATTSSVPVTIYVFDQNDWGVREGNFGLQVWNGAGTLIADVTSPFAKPVGFASGNPKYAVGSTGFTSDGGTWADAQGTYSFGVEERVGVACIQNAYSVGGGSGGANNAGVYLSSFNTSGGNVNVAFRSYGDNRNYNNYVGFRESLTWQFMAVNISYL